MIFALCMLMLASVAIEDVRAGDPNYDPSQDDPLLHAEFVVSGTVVANAVMNTKLSEWRVGGPRLAVIEHEVLSVWIEVAEALRGEVESSRIEVFFWNLVEDYCKPGAEILVAFDATPITGRLLVQSTRGLLMPHDNGWRQVGDAKFWSDSRLRATIAQREYAQPSE